MKIIDVTWTVESDGRRGVIVLADEVTGVRKTYNGFTRETNDRNAIAEVVLSGRIVQDGEGATCCSSS